MRAPEAMVSLGGRKSVAAAAKNINEQHRLARAAAETAIEHAVLCGQLLAEQKSKLKHGEFQPWIEANCDFNYSTAARYMTAAKQISTGVEISSLRHLFPSGQRSKSVEQPKTTRVSHLEPTAPPSNLYRGRDLELPETPPNATRGRDLEQTTERQNTRTSDEPERPDDTDEDAHIAAAEREFMAAAEKALGTDALTEIKRLTAEIAALKVSRDGFMNGKAQVMKMLQAKDRECERLKRELQTLRAKLGMDA